MFSSAVGRLSASAVNKNYRERTSQSEGPTIDREPQKYEGDAVGRPQPVTFRLTASNGKDKEIMICRAYVSREMTVGSQIVRVRWVEWSSCDYSKGLGYCRCPGSAVYNIEEVLEIKMTN